MKSYLIEGKYSFSDLVNIPQLEKLFNQFSLTTGIAIGLVSHPDQKLLIKSGWSDICSKFHRAFPKSELHCKQSNKNLTSKLNKQIKINLDNCELGMVDGATPIIIRGIHIANLFSGQVLFEKPNVDHFKKQAEQYGFNTTAYIEALNKVPIVTEQKFKESLDFICELAVVLAEQGLTSLINQETEKALKESEHKLKEAQSIAHLGNWELDLINNKLYWSDEVFNILGINQQEFEPTYEKFIELIHPDDRQLVNNSYVNSLINKQPYEIEHRLILKNGDVRYVKEKCRTDFDSTGKPLLSVGIIQDITEAKKTIQALDEIELRFEETLNLLPQIVFEINLNGNITYANKRALDMFGYSLEDIQNNFSFTDTIILSDRERALENVQSLLMGNKKENFEYTAIRKDGSTFPCIIYSSIVYKNSKPAGLRGITIDISDLKQLENSIKKSEKWFRAISEQSTEGITVADVNGNYVFSNSAFSRMTGYSSQEILKMNIFDLLENPKGVVIDEKLFGIPTEFTLARKDGTIFPIEIIVNSLIVGSDNLLMGTIKDITERKQAEKEIEDSERKFRELFEKSGDAVMILENALFTDCNQAAIELLNYNTKADILNTHPSELSPQMQSDGINSAIKADEMISIALKNGSHRFEWEYIKKNGKVFPVEVLLTVISNKPDNKVIHVVLRDTTERKKTELKIKKSKEYLEQLTNSMWDAVFSTKMPDRIIEWANDSYNILGYETDEYIGNDTSFLYADKAGFIAFGKEINDALANRKNVLISNHLLKRKNGDIFPADITLTFHKENNEVTRVTSIIRDVSERAQMETDLIKAKEKAEEEERKFKAIINQSTEGITVADLYGNYLIVNPTFCKMSGYTEKELLNTTVYKMKGESQVRKPFYSNNEILAGLPVEVTLKKKDGTEYPTEIVGSVININNQKLILGTIRDITERKIAEDKLNDLIKKLANQNEEYQDLNNELANSMRKVQDMNKELEKAKVHAEESDRLKSAFLANMSHEIRTPMNGIIGFADLLKTPDLSGDELIKYTGIIESSGKRMLNIINDLIDISKIEAGQMEVKLSECDINEQVEYLYIFFKPEAEKKGLSIKINSNKQNELIINTDREKLYAILTNLIKNSIKYTHNGSIDIGYEIKYNNDNSYLEFYVEDTGIGIPKKRQSAIFERFIQADIEDKQVYEGAGLGLAITKAYVELLDGTIWVESTEGIGSKFYFTIPIKLNTTNEVKLIQTPNKLTTNRMKNTKLKILIAEDEEYADTYLSIVLKNISSEIHHAKNGVEAINIFRDNPDIDLILMDIRMPIMNGYKATEEIRNISNSVKIIAQTAHALEGDREKAINIGCDEYISKPINQNELLDIIEGFKF